MTIRPPGRVTRTISLATSNGLGANIAPKMLTTRSKLSSPSPLRSDASPSWNRQFARPSSPARAFPAATRLAAMSTPRTSAPTSAPGMAVVPSPQPRSRTESPLLISSVFTSSSPLSRIACAMRVKSPFSQSALFGLTGGAAGSVVDMMSRVLSWGLDGCYACAAAPRERGVQRSGSAPGTVQPRRPADISRSTSAALVLAFPVLDGRPRPGEHEVLARGGRGGDLPGIEVLDDLGSDHRREHQNPDRRLRAVDDLVRPVLAAREAGDIPLLQHLLTFGRPKGRLAPEHDHPLLVRVVRVVGPELVAGLHLGHARADQLTADLVADERLLDLPTLAVPRFVPLVTKEIEDLHSLNSPSARLSLLPALLGVIRSAMRRLSAFASRAASAGPSQR